MNQQDELATPDEIEFWRAKAEEVGGVLGAHFHDALDRLVRASWSSRPRVVETAEELEALPHRVIVESSAGSIAARFDDEHGVTFGDDRPFPWMRLALPVTVLRMPKETS